jgi:hypothetical protein
VSCGIALNAKYLWNGRHLEEEGVYGDVTLGEFQLDLIPFEKDVLSLEMEDSFRECFLVPTRTRTTAHAPPHTHDATRTTAHATI